MIATHNAHKVTEFQRILAPLGVEIVTADISEPEEDGESFAANARIKAQAACRETGLPAVADDSGLCVDALGGAPGIYSARYGGEGLDDQGRVDLLLKELADVPEVKRGAHFTSAICCVFPDGEELTAIGHCFGSIDVAARGENGFGYDPVFLQNGESFGELCGEEKDRRSHRGQALRQFAEILQDYLKRNPEKEEMDADE